MKVMKMPYFEFNGSVSLIPQIVPSLISYLRILTCTVTLPLTNSFFIWNYGVSWLKLLRINSPCVGCKHNELILIYFCSPISVYSIMVTR